MAEVLGLFASGIAVAQLADQIVRSIRNIRNFWQSIRDAPKDLNDALEELEILGDTLLELQKDLSDYSGPELPRTAPAKCLQYCRKIADDLEAIVVGLQEGLDGKRGRRQWAAIKSAFQKRSLQDFHQRLDRARSMLTLAISSYSLSIHRHMVSPSSASTTSAEQQEIVVSSPRREISQTTARSGIRPLARDRTYLKSSRQFPLFGLYQYHRTRTSARWRPITFDSDKVNDDDDDIAIEHRFIPASWLRLQALSLQSVRSSGVWKYSLRPIRVVPFNSPIFHACREGSLNDIIAILSQGSASLHDVEPNGGNLLHCAAFSSNTELCKWLIYQGIDSNAVNNSFVTPLFYLRGANGDEDRQCDTARVLVEHGKNDPMLHDIWGQTMLHNFRGHLKAFKYLIQLQEQFSVDIAHNDSFHKTPFQRIAAGTSATTIPILLKFLLGAGPISYEKATEVWLELGGPMTLLLGSARRLSAICQYADSIGAELAFISELAIAGADLHVQDFSGATPLDHILNTWSVRTFPEINKERILLEWLGCLSCSGIDLHRYCRKEEELHQDGKLVPVSIYRRNIDRVFTVYYGASPDDVTVLVEDVWRKSASLYNLPGSWDSELEYAERRRLNLIEGHSPSAFWSVTTAGFRDGDYSPKRASCTERITMFGGTNIMTHSDS